MLSCTCRPPIGSYIYGRFNRATCEAVEIIREVCQILELRISLLTGWCLDGVNGIMKIINEREKKIYVPLIQRPLISRYVGHSTHGRSFYIRLSVGV